MGFVDKMAERREGEKGRRGWERRAQDETAQGKSVAGLPVAGIKRIRLFEYPLPGR